MKRLLIMSALAIGAVSNNVVSAAGAPVSVRAVKACPLCDTKNEAASTRCTFCEADLSGVFAELRDREGRAPLHVAASPEAWCAELQKPELWDAVKLAEGHWTIQSAARELIGDMREARMFGYGVEGAVASLDTKWNGTYKGDFKKLYVDYCKVFKA